jgi:hypothetical protein
MALRGATSPEAPSGIVHAAGIFVSKPLARMSSLLAAPALLLLFGVSLPSANEFCDDYADEAAAQAEEAALHPTCALTGPRWDTDRDNHLAWCEALDGPPELATLELATRHAALITCMMSVYGPPSAPSVTKATDSDGADGKINGASDPRENGTEPPKP